MESSEVANSQVYDKEPPLWIRSRRVQEKKHPTATPLNSHMVNMKGASAKDVYRDVLARITWRHFPGQIFSLFITECNISVFLCIILLTILQFVWSRLPGKHLDMVLRYLSVLKTSVLHWQIGGDVGTERNHFPGHVPLNIASRGP